MKRTAFAFFVLISTVSFAWAQKEGGAKDPSPIDEALLTVKVFQFSPGDAFLDAADGGIRSNLSSGTNATFDMRHNVLSDAPVGELDVRLDRQEAVGFRYASFNNSGFVLDGETNGGAGSTIIYNNLDFEGADQFSLDYYRFLTDPRGRWYGCLSVDYYSQAKVDFGYTYNNGAVTLLQYAYGLTGDGVGFTLGFGRELALCPFIALDASLQFRYAKIPKFTGTLNGVSGTQALATSSNGGLALVPDQAVGQNGLKYAPVDLSGIYAMFSLNFYSPF